MPKEMLPVVSKPLIQYGVEEALEAGLYQMAMVAGRGKRALEDHFDISYELEDQIEGSTKEELLKGIRSIIRRATFSYTRQIEHFFFIASFPVDVRHNAKINRLKLAKKFSSLK